MEDKIMSPKAREEMDAVFDQLLSDVETSEEESIKVQEAIEAIAIQLADASGEIREKLYERLEEKLLSLSDNLDQTGIRGMIAMRIMQIQAERNGLSDMSLEEINAEIDAARRYKQ